MVEIRLFVLGDAEYLLCHLKPLFFIGQGFHYPDFVSFFVLRERFFRNLFLIPADDTVGRVNNGGRGAIILFQLAQFVARVIISEAQDILDAGSSERIDTLRVISHHADVFMLFCQFFDDEVLRIVRILVLVHEYIVKFILVLLQYFREITEENIRL